MKRKPVYSCIKRLFDLFASIIIMILIALPMVVIAIAIKCDSKGPVFFKQDRIGKHKKIFKIYKFRSMFIDTDPNAPTHLLKDASSHITKVGKFIRMTSLDELPQIFNIFLGQMSFVGPRPALWNQDDLVAERDKYHANDVVPGLTGLAQVNGRDAIEIPVKAKFDGIYTEKRSLWFDFKILIKTVFFVFGSKGVVEGGTGEMVKPWLTTFYITNNPKIARIAENAGVNRIWIDLETLGKEERQKNIDTVKSHHTIHDIEVIAPNLVRAEMLVRINPWNENSIDEINKVIEAGAAIIMLPYWKTPEEVKNFIATVNGRVKTMLLLETKEAVKCLDEVLKIDGIDELHIGLNDLHLSYHLDFMFELLTNGVVESIIEKVKKKGIPYGFGGISHLNDGKIPAEMIIMEHYRLGSTRAILSRGFSDQTKPYRLIKKDFKYYMNQLIGYEQIVPGLDLEANRERLVLAVDKVVKEIRDAKGNN